MVSTVMTPDVPRLSRHGDRTVVWLEGEHDIATVSVLTDALARAISLDTAHVIVDLSGVTFIGSATIDVLIRTRVVLRQQSRRLTLRSPSKCARRLIEVCGLTGLVEPASVKASRA